MKSILLVDDSPDTLLAMTKLLRLSGYDVRVARTARDAMKVAAGGHIDLLISDLGLPDGDGADVMRDCKSRFGVRGIAVTGYTGADVESACRSAGFDRHFDKPIFFDDLHTAIRELLD